MLLKPINQLLTSYEIKMLAKHKVTTIEQFLNCDNEKIQKYVNLTSNSVIKKIKDKLRQNYLATMISGLNYLESFVEDAIAFSTGINSIDELLNGGIITGDIIEIMGFAGCGKTMIVNTIALNIAEQTDASVIYFDTKNDFSANRLQKMMDSRNISNTEQEKILQKIIVEKIKDVHHLIKALNILLESPKLLSENKIIIIDSIPVIWYLYIGEAKLGLSLIIEAVGLLRKLANDHQFAIITTNLATRWTSLVPDDASEQTTQSSDDAHSAPSSQSNTISIKATLGKDWESVPTHRIYISFLESPHRHDLELDNVERNISLIKSSTLDCIQSSTTITINDRGVV